MLLVLCGCGDTGPERVGVQGKVTLDGNPLEHGRIVFLPIGNHRGPLTGSIIEAGTYQILPADGPTIGELRVEIRNEDPMTKAARENPGTDLTKIRATPEKNLIPRCYNIESELRATTRPDGENVFDFHLRSK